jgi:hypothetical protein
MALEYSLYIQTDFHPKKVLELMFTGIDVAPHIKRSRRKVFISTDSSGLTTYANRFKANEPCFIAEDLGIEVSMSLLFHLDSFVDRQKQKGVFLQATFELLRQTSGDAALLFNGEVVWFVRKEGELILSSNRDLWRPEFLALVTLPYKVKDLPTL